jgi:hypothetical protein
MSRALKSASQQASSVMSMAETEDVEGRVRGV